MGARGPRRLSPDPTRPHPTVHSSATMDSPELYHVKQQFTLGAYKSLVDLTLPEPDSPDYTPTLVYQARAHLALGNTSAASSLIPAGTENVALRAVAALVRYVDAEADAAKEAERDAALEQLRDLCIEIEGDDEDATEWEKGTVRVLAGTAFARAGEVEEALETLGAGTDTRNLEAVAYTVQIYLSISRPDLARKEFERAKRWAEDDLLLQHIEAAIGLATGRDAYADAHAFFTEQLANPSLTSPRLLTARGVTRLLRGEISAAKSDLEEARAQMGGKPDAETLGAETVAAGLGAAKTTEADQLFSQLSTEHPGFPLVIELERKAHLFDELAAKFVVPPVAAV
ncbi:coatomer epsilon subunit-domain-containing protein [Trametes punicea]|nr:coatomer epsilon subunit-domain-containing protein [Trametes punicea]